MKPIKYCIPMFSTVRMHGASCPASGTAWRFCHRAGHRDQFEERLLGILATSSDIAAVGGSVEEESGERMSYCKKVQRTPILPLVCFYLTHFQTRSCCVAELLRPWTHQSVDVLTATQACANTHKL